MTNKRTFQLINAHLGTKNMHSDMLDIQSYSEILKAKSKQIREISNAYKNRSIKI